MTDYARLPSRVKAAVVDMVAILLMMIGMAQLISIWPNSLQQSKGLFFVFILCLYDPLFTSIFGATIGHMVSGIVVKREKNESKNIAFHVAVLRFILKFLIGWISLLTVQGHPKKKAIHDIAAGSIVIYRQNI